MCKIRRARKHFCYIFKSVTPETGCLSVPVIYISTFLFLPHPSHFLTHNHSGTHRYISHKHTHTMRLYIYEYTSSVSQPFTRAGTLRHDPIISRLKKRAVECAHARVLCMYVCMYVWKVKSLCSTKHHAMKTYWGSGGIALRLLDLGTRWRWVVRFTPRPLYPQGKSPWYPLDRGLGGPQSRFGQVSIRVSSSEEADI
jgi:hypothetical protein